MEKNDKGMYRSAREQGERVAYWTGIEAGRFGRKDECFTADDQPYRKWGKCSAIGYIDSIYYSSADDKDLNKSFDKLYDNVNDLTEFATSELNFSKGKFTTSEISIDSNDIKIASSQDDVER